MVSISTIDAEMRSPVAIAGIRGSYSEQAVIEILGKASPLLECEDFPAAFAAVEKGKAKFGVVPVRNKIVDKIESTYGPLHTERFRTLEHHRLKVEHVLVGSGDAELENITTVRSHPEALKQCKRFLSAHPQIIPFEGKDTASCIKQIVEADDPKQTAIGSRRAADLYGGKILADEIMDEADNWTEFCLFIRKE